LNDVFQIKKLSIMRVFLFEIDFIFFEINKSDIVPPHQI